MKTKILRNTFIIVGVRFVLVRLLFAGTNDGVPNFGNMPLAHPPPAIITFDAPGAGTGPFQGTVTYAINPMGTIAGYFFDSDSVTHGFVRKPDGTFIAPIDAPGGGTGPYQGTFTASINPAGAITGFVIDSSYVFHGYLRSSHGTFTTFDVPGAGTGMFQGTYPTANNPEDAIPGNYTDANGVNHGFLRTP